MDLESLQSLNESELRENILIPLFKKMGYKDVRHWHGGILEQGKDSVMWKEGNLGERLNLRNNYTRYRGLKWTDLWDLIDDSSCGRKMTKQEEKNFVEKSLLQKG
jgi:hypothetical protein